MLERKYLLVRSTANYHVYEWIGAPADAKNWVKTQYFSKEELGKDPPAQLYMKVEADPVRTAAALHRVA